MRCPGAVVLVLMALVLAGCSGSTPAPIGPADGGIYGTAMMGPTCPVERDPPDPNCADRPFHGDLVVTKRDDPIVTVKEFHTGDDGTFNVTLPPGFYRIQTPEGQTLPRCHTQDAVTVVAGRYVKAGVACDTGIR